VERCLILGYKQIWVIAVVLGACGSVVVKALCYTPEGRGFVPDEENF
jgi:hypothetical protein